MKKYWRNLKYSGEDSDTYLWFHEFRTHAPNLSLYSRPLSYCNLGIRLVSSLPTNLGIKVGVKQPLCEAAKQVAQVLEVMTLDGNLIGRYALPEIHTIYKDGEVIIDEVRVCFDRYIRPIDCAYTQFGYNFNQPNNSVLNEVVLPSQSPEP